MGADVGVITKETQAYIEFNADTVEMDVEGDITVKADSSEDITSVAAGLCGSGGVSVAIDAAVHSLTITTRAFILGNVHAGGNVSISADDKTEVDKVVGVLAVATYAGIGAAGGITIIDKTTEAFIGADAQVTGDGNSSGITVSTGAFESDCVSAPSFDPNDASNEGIEANSFDTEESNTNTLSEQGEVNVPSLGIMDVDQQGGDDLGDDSFSGQRIACQGN